MLASEWGHVGMGRKNINCLKCGNKLSRKHNLFMVAWLCPKCRFEIQDLESTQMGIGDNRRFGQWYRYDGYTNVLNDPVRVPNGCLSVFSWEEEL